MRKLLSLLIFYGLIILITSCSGGGTTTSSGEATSCTADTLSDISLDCVEDAVTDIADTSTSDSEDVVFSNFASDNATFAFGQTYQHTVTWSGSYTGTVTFSLSNAPSGMTIDSTSGLIEWTPSTASQITTHSNIRILITTASGYVIQQTYDLTVTGTCTSGNVLAIWTGDQRTSTDSSKFLGNITAYTDSSDNCGRSNNLDCTPSNNYEYNQTNSVSENLHIGPETSADDGIMFFYNQYDNTSYTYLFWMFGKGGAAFSPSPNYVKLDLFAAKNESSDNVVVSDDSGETSRQSQSESSGLYSSTYTGRYGYQSGKSDGGVIGPFSGSSYRIFVDRAGTSTINSATLTLGNLDSFIFWSKDNSSFPLGDVDNFTVGFKTSIECN